MFAIDEAGGPHVATTELRSKQIEARHLDVVDGRFQ
jgi:hypothetical protein